MTISELQELISRWIGADLSPESRFQRTYSLINYLERVLYCEYGPTKLGGHGSFHNRLANWLGSADEDAHKRVLFLMLDHLFFIGEKEMEATYLTAYSKHVVSWLMHIKNISVFDPDAPAKIRDAIERTLFTGITDSFRIAFFIQINNLQGHPNRPVWETEIKDWDETRFINKFMTDKEQIVMLEDFVGSGSQMESALKIACNITSSPPVLLCPLIICPAGTRLAHSYQTQFQHLKFSPVLNVQNSHFIGVNPGVDEHQDFAQIREVVNTLHFKVTGSPGSWIQNYGPMGYADTGAFIVKHDNCPDNTLPTIHRRSDLGWSPLFLRTSREAL